jgi:arginine/ornithine transport system permease protein
MNFAPVFANYPIYLEGLMTSLGLVFLALLAGFAMALPLALANNSRQPLLHCPAWAFVYFFRGTPLLVQLFLVYFGLGQFEFIQNSIFWPLLKQAWWCALITFTLNTAAYTSEIIRGAINNTPRGEIEAARAYGMSHAAAFRRIIFPGAIRRALPAYSNEVIFMLHGSAIAGTITLVDLTEAARRVINDHYNPFEAYIGSAVLYMAVTFVLVGLFRLLEKKWTRHLRPVGHS